MKTETANKSGNVMHQEIFKKQQFVFFHDSQVESELSLNPHR